MVLFSLSKPKSGPVESSGISNTSSSAGKYPPSFIDVLGTRPSSKRVTGRTHFPVSRSIPARHQSWCFHELARTTMRVMVISESPQCSLVAPGGVQLRADDGNAPECVRCKEDSLFHEVLWLLSRRSCDLASSL